MQVFPQLPAMNLPPALVDAMMKELENTDGAKNGNGGAKP
jgi:hypothetical protein